MRHSLVAAVSGVVFLIGSAAAEQGTSERGGGWRILFDGKSLDGWEHVGPGKMVLVDGQIRTEGGMGLLWYAREKLGNCTLRVVFKTATPRANSGLYIRVADRPKDEWYAVRHGYEVQIMDAAPGDRGTGLVYTFARATARPAKAGEWNTLEVTLKGDRVSTTINGVPVAEFDPGGPVPPRKDTSAHGDPERGPRPESGYIGLQNHDKDSIVFFKEVSVRPLESNSH
jgi:Domain of Unknown Function (DUF1080)